MKNVDDHVQNPDKTDISGIRDDGKPLPTQAQLPVVVMDKVPEVTKLEAPEKGTSSSETARNLFDATLSAVPVVGGALVGIGRHALPSERDKKTAKWQSDVTDTVNRTSDELREQKETTEAIQLEQERLRGDIDATAEKVEQLSQRELAGVTEPDPHGAEFAIYRTLIEQEKYLTAIGLLRTRLEEAETDETLPPKSAARAISLVAMCEKGLGNEEDAARLFFEASDLDPQNLKHRANLVVAYLLRDDPEGAERCLDELLDAEPNSVMHWANWVYVKSAQGILADVTEIPEELRRAKDVCVARVVTLRANDDSRWHEEAKRALALHPASRTLRRAAAEGDLERASSLIVAGKASPAEISDATEKAHEAADLLLRLWREHTRTELYPNSPDLTLLQNTIMGLRLSERFSEARVLVKPNIDALFADRQARAAVAGLAMQMDDDALLDRALEIRFLGDAPLRLERALDREQWKEALEIIELQAEDLEGQTRIPPKDMAHILQALLLPEADREKAFEEALGEIAPDAHSYLIVSRLARRFGAVEIGNKSFEHALSQDVSGDREVRLRLASECMDHDQPERAIKLLEGHVDAQVETRERRVLAMSYGSTDVPVASGVEFFRIVQRAGNAGEKTQRAGGHFHLNRRRPQDAIPWFRRALNLEPNKTRTQLALWQSLTRAGKEREAKSFLATIDLDFCEGTLRDRMDLCQVLWRSGRRDALDHAYEIAVRNQADVGVCHSYVGLILGDVFGSGSPPMPESSQVGADSFVRLSRSDQSKPFEFVVVEADDEVPLHLSLEHPLVAAAMGKAVGEQFETETGPNRFMWRIEEVKSKFLHLFHDLSHTLQDRFPDQTTIWSVTIKGDDLTPILESLKARRDQIERVETLYRENPMPLAAVASAGGGDAINFALHLAQSGQEMFSATGRTPDTKQEASHARRAVEKGVVVDTYTGWLLSKFGVLRAVREVFKTVLVPASSIDEFAAMLENMGAYEDGRLTAAADGDEIVSIHQSAEDLRAQIDDLKSLSTNLTNSCQVVGIEVSGDLDPKLRELSDFLGTQFDTISVAQREGCTVLSADLRLRQITHGVFEFEAFGMDALLDLLLSEGAIDETERAEALLTMAALRHSYIGLNAPTLLKMMKIDETDGMVRFERVSKYFGRPDADIASHVTTAAAFASLAFEDRSLRRNAKKATSMILRNLVRFKGVPLMVIVNAFARRAGDPEITSYVASWLRGHFLLDIYQAQIDESDTSNAKKQR